MLERRAPLDQVARARPAATIDAPGLRVVPVADLGLLLLQGDAAGAPLAGAIRDEVGIALPGPQAVGVQADRSLAWMAPREFLLELPAARTSTMQAALLARLGTALAAVTDVSDAYAGFDVSGEAAAEVLMTGCSLDLRPHAFAAERVARTAFAGVPVVIRKRAEPDQFRCLVDRSLAEHFWNWLAQAPR